jgi:UDP-glucose 4-epimerase
MPRSIVTGGAGFIGSHLVDALVAAGDEVLVVDDLSTGSRENISVALERGATLVQADITEPEALRTLGFPPDRIFHLAGQADARKAIADPVHDARVNVIGTINALDLARDSDCPLVFSSTGGVSYGEGEGRRLPFTEDDETHPETAYGVSKLCGEKYASFYRLLHGTRTVSLRLGNVYGPRQDPHGEAGVVAIFCGRLLEGEAPIVFGDGGQTRDYIYIDDVVTGLLTAEQALRTGTAARDVYNIGTGVETSVLDLVATLAEVSGVESEPEFRPHRTGEIQRVAISPAAAEDELGWRARADLAPALERTFAWARSQRDASRVGPSSSGRGHG